MKYTELAKKIGITPPAISMIANGKRRASWDTAKKLSLATNTTIALWIEGDPDERDKAIRDTE